MNTELMSVERICNIANKVSTDATIMKARDNGTSDMVLQMIASLKVKSDVESLVLPEVANEDDLDINDVLENYDISADCNELTFAGLESMLFIQDSNIFISVGECEGPSVIYQLDNDVELSVSCRHFATFLSKIELISDELIVPFANAAFADVIKHIESIH